MKMMFDDWEDFSQYIPVNVSFSLQKMKGKLAYIQSQYIRPLLGKELYEKVLDDLEQGSAEALTLTLIEYIKYAVASLAFHEQLPFLQVHISDEGIQVINSENSKPAFRWQVEKLEASSLRSGHHFLEQILAFLETHREDFPLWFHADRAKYFIHSATAFNEEVFINASRLIYLKLLPAMNRVEKRIRARISLALFNQLKMKSLAGELLEKEAQLVELLCSAIANLTYSNAVRSLPISFEGGNMVIFSNEFPSDFDPKVMPEAQLLAQLARQHHAEGEKGLRKVIKFIESNITDFPLYKDSGLYTAPEDRVERDIEDSGFFFL